MIKITTFEKLKMDLIMWVEWKGQNVGRIHTKDHTKSLASGRIWSVQISTTEGASE